MRWSGTGLGEGDVGEGGGGVDTAIWYSIVLLI